MPKTYIVRLTDEERDTLNQLLKKRGVGAQRVRRALMLLKADVEGPRWTDAKLAEAYGCRTQTVENLRESLVTEGFETTLQGKPKSRVRSKVLDGEQEAKIIALRLGHPPQGWANWTLRLLAEQAVTLEIVESVSYETLRRMLKKTSSRRARSRIG
jgi:Homeodomain-like domain